MNYARLESRICLDEGFRAMPYLDTVGVATIGYGTTAVLGVPVTLNDPAMTDGVARQILRQDLFGACKDAQALFSRFNEFNDVRQEVLANLAYNLGRTRLARFTKLIAAAQVLNHVEMAEQMKRSKWFEQVGERGLRLYYAMQRGEW